MSPILFILLVIVLWLFIDQLAGTLTLWKDFKKYKSTYKLLPLMKFEKRGDLIYGIKPGETHENCDFIFFTDCNDFKIGNRNYIHYSHRNWNPYTKFWYNKYKKWMIEHLKLEIKNK